MPETPGLRLKVLASGLHQLANKCEKIAGELAADAQPPSTSTSGWQSSAVTARTAAARAGKDLSSIATRINARGAHYSAAATAYTQTEEQNTRRLRGLVH
ncbi:MAG TPA: hypothetical protein VMC78_12385 [Mycobacterium sp.]|nr:hypothetical protein [Mycobacterium sp.]